MKIYKYAIYLKSSPFSIYPSDEYDPTDADLVIYCESIHDVKKELNRIVRGQHYDLTTIYIDILKLKYGLDSHDMYKMISTSADISIINSLTGGEDTCTLNSIALYTLYDMRTNLSLLFTNKSELVRYLKYRLRSASNKGFQNADVFSAYFEMFKIQPKFVKNNGQYVITFDSFQIYEYDL